MRAWIRFLVFLGLLLPTLPFAAECAGGVDTPKSSDGDKTAPSPATLTISVGSQTRPGQKDSYEIALESQSIAEQREALRAILDDPSKYTPQIQQSLRDYPRLLRSNPIAAKRSVYISALVRDPSFPPILVKSLGVPDVLDECEYACPVVFALTIQACFGGWVVPANLDSQLTTVHDLKSAIDYMPRISLKVGSIEDVTQGPGLEEHRSQIAGKTEDELIKLAGPMTGSQETRMYAALRLETLVSKSKNRIEFYLLALNDFEDGSGEYKSAIYQSIYRAELAKVRGLTTTTEAPPSSEPIYVGILDDAREKVWHSGENVVDNRLVMPAFQKNGSEWQSISSFSPIHMNWTIAFDGENLGQIETHANTKEGSADQLSSPSSRAKQFIVTRSSEVPVIGKPSPKFTGGSFLVGLREVRRPLVAVSKPYYRDPDGWKRAKLPEEIASLVRAGFRQLYPRVDRCEHETIAEHDWKYPDSAITLPIAYSSSKNSYIVAVTLEAGDCGWGGEPDVPTDPWVHQWFLVEADRSVRRIGGFEELLDAGDYDNDGSSEIIFFSTRSESSDRYDLVYDNLRKSVTIEIGYR